MQTNRQGRRAKKAQAKATAEKAASRTYDFTRDGKLVRVTDPRAIRVLRRAFEMMLRRMQPLTLEISEGEASKFPRWHPTHAGMTHVLAVYLDREGRCSYALRSCTARDVATGEVHLLASAEAATQAAKAGLAAICAQRGFPITTTEGRA